MVVTRSLIDRFLAGYELYFVSVIDGDDDECDVVDDAHDDSVCWSSFSVVFSSVPVPGSREGSSSESGDDDVDVDVDGDNDDDGVEGDEDEDEYNRDEEEVFGEGEGIAVGSKIRIRSLTLRL